MKMTIRKIMMTAAAAMTLAACQDKGPEGETPSDDRKEIAVSLTEITHDSVSGTITPPEKDMSWILFLEEKETVEAFETDEALLADDMKYFRELAESLGTGIAEVLGDLVQTGTFEGLISDGLFPETDYTIYVYGIALDGTALTKVTRVNFTTSESGNANFRIAASAENSSVTVSVTPSDNSVAYYFDIVSRSELERKHGGDIAAAAQSIIDRTGEQNGVRPEEFADRLGSLGPDEYTFTGLVPGTDYVVFACAIDPATALVCSDVATARIRTADVASSDNVITLNINEVTGTSAFISVGTTNGDPYVLTAERTDMFEGYGDEEIAQAIISGYGDYIDYILYEGDQEDLELYGLIPGTEYHVIAFGYNDGGASTGVIRKTITTAAAGNPADCRFEFTVTGIRADAATLIAIPSDPLSGYCYDIVPEGTTEEEFFARITGKVKEQAEESGADILAVWETYFCRRGSEIRRFKGLEAGRSYVPVAAVIDEKNGGFAARAVFGEPFRTLAEGEIPDGKISLELKLAVPSALYDQSPDELKEYPDHECLGFAIIGENIASGTYAFRKTSELEGYTEKQYDTLMMFADDLSDIKLSLIEKDGYYTDIFIGLEPDTSYTFIVQARDALGNVVRKKVEARTATAAR